MTDDRCAWCHWEIAPTVNIEWNGKRFDQHSCRARYIEAALIEEAEAQEKRTVLPVRDGLG